MKRKILIGDVHGCKSELVQLLEKVNFDAARDRLIFVGDLVDRGPDSAGVIDYVRKLGSECVLGNHEEKQLRWNAWEERVRTEGVKNPMQMTPHNLGTSKTFSEEQFEWMRSLPLTIRFQTEDKREWLVVHGGFETTDQDPESQNKKKIIRMRLVNEKGHMTARPGYVPDGAVLWSKRWSRKENVVYGHNAFTYPRVDTNSLGSNCFGIDTGCCFGNALTALILDWDELSAVNKGYKFVQVKAEREHFVNTFGLTEERLRA